MIRYDKGKMSRYALVSSKDKIVKSIVKSARFSIQKKIYENYDTINGMYYMRSLIFKGTYKGKDAVLKIHGVKNQSYDVREVRNFERQNESKIISAPEIYFYNNWNNALGYAFTIFEYIDSPEIVSRPFPRKEELADFARFYQEYKTKAVTKPWRTMKTGKSRSISILYSLDAWLKNAKAKKRLKFNDYAPYLIRFYSLLPKYVEILPMEFMHMHLYPEHIRKDGEKFILLDQMSWGYRFQWADLSYMIWRSILDIRDNDFSANELIDYVNMWIKCFKSIPVVKKDKNFEDKIAFLILERSLGIIIGDLAFGKYWGTKEGKKYFKHKLHSQQKLFNYFADKLDG